jgi:hypothetical protein
MRILHFEPTIRTRAERIYSPIGAWRYNYSRLIAVKEHCKKIRLATSAHIKEPRRMMSSLSSILF